MVTFEEFQNIDLRIAKVLVAERVPGSEKLVRLEVDIGERTEINLPAVRQIVAGIGKSYEPQDLTGKEIVIVANLEPRKLMNLESHGMVLVPTDASGKHVLLMPEREVEPGAKIK